MTKPPKRGRGRPKTPPDEIHRLMVAVCDRIAKGDLVKYAAIAEGTDHNRVREWGLTPEYSGLYEKARIAQAHALAEQAVEIADGEDALTLLYEEAVEAEEDGADTDALRKAAQALRANIVARARLRLDARKWLTSKIAPKLYGERLDVTTGGEKIQSGIVVLPPTDR
jgi:hypothetical protein